MNRTLYKLPYQPVEDFVPVAQTSWGTLVLVSNPSKPLNSVAELIAAAKQEPNKLVYGSPGVGTPHHLAMALFNDLTHTRSEERRVGKEWVRTCRSRGSP